MNNPLNALIHQEIKNAGGCIPFARFMELALYAPGLGYYSAGSHKLGKGGDFVTAPEISPLFAQCVANQCQQILTELGQGDILELGAGSGVLAKDVLLALEKQNCLPEHYYILEISADLRERQHILLQTHCPYLLSRIHWLDTLPENFIGILFANEVIDAMPINCFQMQENNMKERCVSLHENEFTWQLTEPSTPELASQLALIQEKYAITPGYESEINLMLPGWIYVLAHSLKKGVILLIDYGYGQAEYYYSDRYMGTLMCYYQHQAHSNPFIHVGLQDITAHVNFTTVAESAVTANLTIAGYTTQASFLLACGLMDAANQNLPDIDRIQQNQAIRKLTMPSQMGESVKAIALSKNMDIPLIGFSLHDRKRDL